MERIETNLKRLAKYLCGVYFAIPNPEFGGILIARYAREFQHSKLAQRVLSHNRLDEDVA